MAIEIQELSAKDLRYSKDRGIRIEFIPLDDGNVAWVYILSLRNRHHRDRVVEEIVQDKKILFHGWGVEGAAGRVDQGSQFQEWWTMVKQGRPPGAKIPLLEPPYEAVRHIDWDKVHPQYRYLREPRSFERLWRNNMPFHIIAPYRIEGGSLSEAVVTPAYDPDVALNTPVPTICLFWMEDPAMRAVVREVKKRNPKIQVGVSSHNDSGVSPEYNTNGLLDNLRSRKNGKYRIVVEDPLLEPLDIGSSHAQFSMPLEGEDTEWVEKRHGSLSAETFRRITNFPVRVLENPRTAARKHSLEENLDGKLYEAARRIRIWYLKSFFRLV